MFALVRTGGHTDVDLETLGQRSQQLDPNAKPDGRDDLRPNAWERSQQFEHAASLKSA